MIEDTEATVLFVGEEFVPLLEAISSIPSTVERIVVIGRRSGYESYDSWLAGCEPVDPGSVPDRHDVCLRYYSSGTTDRPKGVMLTNDNFFSSIDANNATLGFHDNRVSLVVMPLFHVVGGAWAWWATTTAFQR